MIHLATGITPDYLERAAAFLASLRLHTCGGMTEDQEQVHSLVFCVDFRTDHHKAITNLPTDLDCRVIDYAKAPLQLPKKMLQNGNFIPFSPTEWRDDDIIIFTDADAELQRSFTGSELEWLKTIEANEIRVGYNRPNEAQSLWDEAACLTPKAPLAEIEAKFPGIREMRCGNFGFVVARKAAWHEILQQTLDYEYYCREFFDNPARVQWMSCYAAQSKGMKMTKLPPTMHAHGHLGLRTGLRRDEDGLWRQDGEIVLFAHAL